MTPETDVWQRFASALGGARDAPVVVLAPVYNDSAGVAELLRRLARHLPAGSAVVLVDDGSAEAMDAGALAPESKLAVGVVRLRSNVGHQRAIAIGLSFLHGWVRPDAAVVVMDADGEDDPADVPRLLEALARQPGHIVVANRARRSESLGFRIGYGLYRAAYRALTGHAIRSGNFCAMRGASVRRLAYIPSLWNHLAATIYKSRLPVAGIEVARGRRYAGQSRMNLIDLMVHGLSAISVHMEAAGVRVLVLALGFSATALAAGLFVVHRRLFTDLAIPGWASVLSTLFILLAAVGLSAALTLVFLVLSARDRRPVIPAVDGHYWVEGVERLG